MPRWNNEHEQLMKIAKAQRGMILTILFLIGGIVGIVILGVITDDFKAMKNGSSGEMILVFVTLIFLAASIAHLFFYFRLASSLGKTGVALLGVLGGFLIPLLSVGILIWLSSKATKLLRAEGYEVGFLGANIEDLEADTRMGHRYRDTFR